MSAHTVYRVLVVGDIGYVSIRPGHVDWATRTPCGGYYVQGCEGNCPPGLFHPAYAVQVLDTAVEFDTPGDHISLGYVFEQHKDLALAEDS